MDKIKPGYKTTEFWITLVAAVAGTVLLAFGQEKLYGTLVLVANALGYPISRGIAKAGSK